MRREAERRHLRLTKIGQVTAGQGVVARFGGGLVGWTSPAGPTADETKSQGWRLGWLHAPQRPHRRRNRRPLPVIAVGSPRQLWPATGRRRAVDKTVSMPHRRSAGDRRRAAFATTSSCPEAASGRVGQARRHAAKEAFSATPWCAPDIGRRSPWRTTGPSAKTRSTPPCGHRRRRRPHSIGGGDLRSRADRHRPGPQPRRPPPPASRLNFPRPSRPSPRRLPEDLPGPP
jgi:hypothetical protein